METVLMLGVILAVVAFNLTGGFHDAAEITAPGVVTRAVRPATALGLFALMAFVGPFVAGTAVANTIAGFVDLDDLAATDALLIILAGVLGATAWNVATWRLSIPSSSTHSLVGGIIGVTIVAAGPGAVVWGTEELLEGNLTGVMKIVVALLVSPILGVLAGAIMIRLGGAMMGWATRAAHRQIRRVQLSGTAVLAFAHGANDAQKGMGVIALALVLGGRLPSFSVPIWVVVLSSATLVVGGILGGWGIARTLGFGIYRLEPLHGASAQGAAAAIIYGAALVGGPVSTTQVVGSTITGVGAGEHPRSVRWDTSASMAIVWVVTLPAAAAAGLVAYGFLALALAPFG
jgi:PiT family inorganic phosphate transporter